MNNQTQQISTTQNTYEIIDISNLYKDDIFKKIIKAEQQDNNILILYQLVTPLIYNNGIYQFELQYKHIKAYAKQNDSITYWNKTQINIDLQLFQNFELVAKNL